MIHPTTPTRDTDETRGQVEAPNNAANPNPTEQRSSESSRTIFHSLEKEPENFKEVIERYRRRIEEGKMTYLDALEIEAMNENNMAVLTALVTINHEKPKEKWEAYPLTFKSDGSFSLDLSYRSSRAMHDSAWKVLQTVTADTLCTEFDNDRENLQTWAEFAHFFYQSYTAGPTQTKEALEHMTLACVGLGYLQHYYEVKDGAYDPKKTGIVAHAFKALTEGSAILQRHSERLAHSNFPAEIKRILTDLGEKEEMACIGELSFKLQFLLDDFVIKGPYQFLNEFGDRLNAGGSSNRLALALACLFWTGRKSFMENPESALQKLQAGMNENSKQYHNFIKAVREKLDAASAQLNEARANLAAARRDKAKSNMKLIATTVTMIAGSVLFGISKGAIAAGTAAIKVVADIYSYLREKWANPEKKEEQSVR